MKGAVPFLNRDMRKAPSPHLRFPCLSVLTLIGGRLPGHGSGVIRAGLPSPFQSPKAGKAPLKTAVCAQKWQGQPRGFKASLFPAVFCLKGEPAAQPCVLVRRRALNEAARSAGCAGPLPFRGAKLKNSAVTVTAHRFRIPPKKMSTAACLPSALLCDAGKRGVIMTSCHNNSPTPSRIG